MLERWIIDELVRELAYHKWQQAGCPDDMGIQFWLDAEREVLDSLKGLFTNDMGA